MGSRSDRDFRLLVAGQATSQLGTQVSSIAIPLLAVVSLHASALQLGLISASSTIAFAVIALPVGAWTDRWPRRPVLVASDVARALLLATIPLAWALGGLRITQLLVVALAAGFARVFFDIGYQSYIPTVVGAGGVLKGNSTMETIRAGGQFAGPALGGWLVGLIGAASVVSVQAGTFAVSAASLLAIRAREPRRVRAEGPPTRIQIAQGLRFVVHNRILRAMALTSAMGNFAFAIGSSVTVIYLSRSLGMSAAVIGDVLAAGALAAMAGAAATPRLARRVGSVRVIWLSLVVTTPFGVLTVLAGHGWAAIVLVVVGMAAGEFGQILYAITSVSLRQRAVAPELLGRVNATMRFLIMGLTPLGAVVGGVLGDAIGARWTLLVSVLVVALSPVPSWRSLRRHRSVEDVPTWTIDLDAVHDGGAVQREGAVDTSA